MSKIEPALALQLELRDNVETRRERVCRYRATLPLSVMADVKKEGGCKTSAWGCCLAVAETLKVGTIVKLSSFSSIHPSPMRIDEAIVRWVAGGRMGLEFVSLGSEPRESLHRLVIQLGQYING